MEKREWMDKIIYVLQCADTDTLRKVYTLLIKMIGYDVIFGGTK